jgi:hypothetical protein
MKLIAKSLILVLLISMVISNFPHLVNIEDGKTYHIQVLPGDDKVYLVTQHVPRMNPVPRQEIYDIALKYHTDDKWFDMTIRTRQTRQG